MSEGTSRALRARIEAALNDALVQTAVPGLPPPVRGKVRDVYDLPDGKLLIVATDRQSAFDQVLAAVPFKGQVLTGIAQHWFDATADLCPNHLVAIPDPNAMVARRLAMLPVEVVVRDYLTGTTATSIWPMYRDGARLLYGHRFGDGLRQNEKLPETIVTPTTKGAAGAHDEPLSGDAIVSRGLLSRALWQEVQTKALALFARGREMAAARGLILVDTKYEFGLDADGLLTLGDEVHTPDSSRFWLADSYPQRFREGSEPEALDKDFLRRWIAARCDPYRQPIPPIPAETLIDFAERYIALFERVTGRSFVPPPPQPSVAARLEQNVQRFVATACSASRPAS